MTLWAFEQDEVATHCAIENFLSKEECQSVIDLGLSKELKKAKTFVGDDPTRKSNVSWLWGSDISWLFRKLTDACLYVNKHEFHFDLIGLGEGLQFTQYKPPGGKYGVHTDSGPGSAARKISFVVQLSNPEDYEGGELRLHYSDNPLVIPKRLGSICFFPSYVLHEVMEVTQGERFSLVGWATGPNFK